MPMDAYDVTRLPGEQVVLLVLSTSGQGEFPDNARAFWRFLLRKSLPADSLRDLSFGLFALGDSSYPKYNVAGIKLYRRMQGLGATPLLELDQGLGDDQHPHGYEAKLLSWMPDLWAGMEKSGLLPLGSSASKSGIPSSRIGSPRYRVTVLDPKGEEGGKAEAANRGQGDGLLESVAVAEGFARVAASIQGCPSRTSDRSIEGGGSKWRPILSRVLRNERLSSPDHFQDIRHMELDLAGNPPTYNPGDIMNVWPRATSEAVDAFLSRMRLDGTTTILVEAAERPPESSDEPCSVQGTLRAFIEGVLDVAGASPRRRFFHVMSAFATSSIEEEKLTYLSSSEGRDDLWRYNQREGRTVAEVLGDFKSVESVPLSWLFEVVPIVRPRQFSVSSSGRMHPGVAHLTVALVEWITPYKRCKMGHCSSYLASLIPFMGSVGTPVGSRGGDIVACWLEPGTFQLPGPSTPLILVGPGTGLAPLRSLIQDREMTRRDRGSGPGRLAPCALFFGCRNIGKDSIYMEEMKSYQESGVLFPWGLSIAASRDQPQKIYVSQKLIEHGQALWDLIQRQGAVILISGSAKKMPTDVCTALEQVACAAGGMTAEEAKAYIRKLEATRRIQIEAW